MATDSLKQMEESQIRNLEEKTGKKFTEWIAIARESGLEKHGELVTFLKEKYNMGHGYANLVVHHARESHAGFSENDELIEEQYKGKENLRPWYDRLIKEISGFGSDVEISPKKTYVSLRRKKQFALIQPSTKTRLDIGLILKDTGPTGKLEAGGSWNAMCTHRIRIEKEEDLDSSVTEWLRKAYELAG